MSGDTNLKLMFFVYASKGPTKSADGRGATTGQGTGDGDGGGLSWLTSVAERPGSGPSARADTSSANGVGAGGADPDDWLSVAQSSGQTKRKQNVTATGAKGGAAPAAPGGWLSSGNLGVSTKGSSDSDDDVAGGGAATATTKRKKRKQARGSASAVSGPVGWLASGALGAPAEDESDDDGEGSDGRNKPILVTVETQTDNDIEAIVERGDVPKLPPWAKPYAPPPKPEPVPDVAAEVAVTAQEDVSSKDTLLPRPVTLRDHECWSVIAARNPFLHLTQQDTHTRKMFHGVATGEVACLIKMGTAQPMNSQRLHEPTQ